MSNRKFEMYEYRQIILRMRRGESNRIISQNLKLSRNTAKKIRAIAKKHGLLENNSSIPDDDKLINLFLNKATDKANTKINIFSKKISIWYRQGISATAIYNVLTEQHNFNGSYNCVQRYIKSLKKQDNLDVTIILEFKPRECAQVDFGYGPLIHDLKSNKKIKTWFFVMTLCWSRHQYAEIIEHQDTETWLNCHQRAFKWFNGIPPKIIIDNAACAIAKTSYTEPEPTKSYLSFAEDYNLIISACPPYDPKKKGRVESGVKYIKRNFLPLKSFNSLSDANQQLKNWILKTAGNRIHGTTKEKPLVLFATEQNLLAKLPGSLPEICLWKKGKVYRDCHVRFKNKKYSVSYKLVNETVWICSTDSTVKIYHNHQMIAVHPKNPINNENKSTHLEHLPPSAQAFLSHDDSWCREQAKLVGINCELVTNELLDNKHVDYLRAAQQLIYLKNKYKSIRLELACKRAIEFDTPKYGVIKEMLKNGIDSEAISEEKAFDILAKEVYGSDLKYCRVITSIKN